MLVLSSTASAPTVQFTLPPSHLLRLPPVAEPRTLSPPLSDHTFARPFNINDELYNGALNTAVPISIAITYAIVVTILNRVNRQREHKPWDFSKSSLFYVFVLTHNVVLALYSGWTCLGMLNAYWQSWPGWNGENGLAGAVDALCKIHGPRGLGSAATYNHGSSSWGVTDTAIRLLEGSPDSTDVGRLWNEGLAFYGWLFYISKFYEVFDTFIILAKGKKSSLLQTYHHAGAMMCMWAGIRYMSPPIWMFVFINSGLHAVMYTYYALATLSIPVPPILKRTLTTLQIAQFIFGGTYAVAHLFIAYSVPVSIPYLFVHNLSSAIPSAVSSVSAVASATASAGFSSWLKKAALRAAGEEGLAENVRNNQGETFGVDAIHAAEVEKAQEEIRYRTEYQTINCLDTSGQAFAILLNALYLAPLTYLFINFFIQSYIRRVRTAPPPPDRKQITKDSSRDAVNNVEREIHDAMAEEQSKDDIEIPADIKAKISDAKANLKKGAQNLGVKTRKSAKSASDALQDKAHATKAQVMNKKDDAAREGKEAGDGDAEDGDAEDGEAGDEDVEEVETLDTPGGDPEKEKNDEKANDDRKDQGHGKKETRRQNDEAEAKHQDGDDENKPRTGDEAWDTEDEHDPAAEAYEVRLDEILNADEKAAEREMQDESWNTEDGHDPEAEAYEVKLDAVMDAEEKAAEREMQGGP